jgi:hypothetical protein
MRGANSETVRERARGPLFAPLLRWLQYFHSVRRALQFTRRGGSGVAHLVLVRPCVPPTASTGRLVGHRSRVVYSVMLVWTIRIQAQR